METSSAESPSTEPTKESVRNHYDRMGPRKGSIQTDTAAVKNHPITAGGKSRLNQWMILLAADHLTCRLSVELC